MEVIRFVIGIILTLHFLKYILKYEAHNVTYLTSITNIRVLE